MSPKELNQDTASGFTTSSPIEAAWRQEKTVDASVGSPRDTGQTQRTHRAALAFPAFIVFFTAAATLGKSPPFFFACAVGSIPGTAHPNE